MFQLSDYDYHLPEKLIAQRPCGERSQSRLLRVKRELGRFSHHKFFELESFLNPGDLLVVNNTRVIPARLMGQKESGGRVEVLIIDYAAGMKHLDETGVFQCDCLLRASRRPKPGTVLFMEGGIRARVVSHRERVSAVAFEDGPAFIDRLKGNGQIPLPPYIKRYGDPEQAEKDKKNYQTVYAEADGAVAAPTAGLHFTERLMAGLQAKGVGVARITLHVGYGTFVPVRVADIRDHEIHSEFFTVSQEAARMINETKARGGRVVAVGTTSVRTLEFIAGEDGRVAAGAGQCNLFIYPGYRFKCVDAMVTNFHLPKSTLLMLISAFYDRKKILDAYGLAVDEKYRFFSYGDAMFIE
ncbi:MAG: tRNA preQ1(34) S-adenosylmethionine ribosyltransferase-isomerase QueA [Desulfobacter sp.]|nr:MAG: tRNA preQ1(34) S-adenosylmethionine ribosyltransferase-isomerase QueA [Desulfobacter sp.]